MNNAPSGTLTVNGIKNADGEFQANDTVSVSHNLADEDGLGDVSYEWHIDGVLVASTDSYTLVDADAGKTFTVSASYTDGFGNPHTVTTDAQAIASALITPVTVFTCPENDSDVYFCDDFENGSLAKWNDLISTYGLDAPGVFDVLDDGVSQSMRFTAGTRGGNKVDGELILVKGDQFTNVPNNYALEYRIRPRNNSNTGNKYLFAMLRYESPLNWYLGGLNMQSSTSSTQVEAGYASTADEIQRKLQVKAPIELGEKGGTTDGVWYTVRFDAIDDTLTAYLDGQQLGSWQDDKALYNAAGLIGFYTYNRSFEVDYVKVFNPAIKPVQLALNYTATEWVSAAGSDPLAINVSAIQNDGSTADTFTAISSDSAIVEVSVNGNTVTLTPKAQGNAQIVFTAGSDKTVQKILNANIEPAWIMPTTDYGNLGGAVSPDLGATGQYIDGKFAITFDNTPTGLGTTGEVRIFNANGDLVDRIKASGETNEIGLSADNKTRVLNQALLTLNGNQLIIEPHRGVINYNETYTVTIGNNVVLGAKLNGMDFNGLGDNAGWQVSTQAQGPDASATSITVDDDGDADFRTVQAALTWVMQNTAQDAAITINVKNGTYNERLYLRNKDNLSIIGESRDGVNIAAENYEGINTGSGKGTDVGSKPAGGRSLFLVEGGDLLTLENLTITNTHVRTGSGDQAETLYFNSKTGRLIARDANFISEQDTLLMKGYNWFYNSKVAGNVDFIWGYSVATVFENSQIVTLGDSKVTAKGETTSSGGYVLQARTENASDPGFVFLNSELSHAAGPKGVTVQAGSTYLARSGGDAKVFDNVTFVNTKMADHIATIGWAYKGINSQPAPTPETASAASGWKEYNSMDANGNPLDMSSRCDNNGSCYELTQQEYENQFCSRAQVFAGFNNGAGWDPHPTDTSDDHCPSAKAEAWKEGAAVLGGSGTSASGSIVTQSANEVTMTAKGGKFESAKVSFYLVSQEVTGDFEITANLNSISGGILRENSSYQFPAGLMMCICDGSAATVGTMAHIGVNDINGSAKTLADASVDYVASYGHFTSTAADASWGKTGSTAVVPGDDLYFKLKRDGNDYYVYYSTDGGVNYNQYGASNLSDLPASVKVGMFAAPNGSSNEPTIVWKDIKISQ
ncbi:pectin methylesterase (plasmid) [Saccharobesus litoralis]|uniref:Pectin methylesterase n=2 Tax=Saccharobesus litoralis TaxID=2172099 RepID=A0A2S0VYG4_9ALTE|nr:pectin methylesterase [Saccharobesus litoralis]